MRTCPCILVWALAVAMEWSLVPAAALSAGENWPAWRGPRGDGTSLETNLPTKWDADQNVIWKIELPEAGNSTPIVWDDRIYLTQPLAAEKTRALMCFSTKDGSLVWKSGRTWDQEDPTHATNPLCSSSPVTDGKRIIAWYGSAGLTCYDMTGKEVWHRDLGIQKHIWGYGSSPVILNGVCYLLFGPGERSFLIAVDCESGQTLWQHDEPINKAGTAEAKFTNPDYYGSWSTPVIRSVSSRDELVVSLPFRLCGFEPRDGKIRWSSEGLNALVYTSPLVQDDLVVSMGGFSGMTIAVAVDGDATGDITQSHRLWRHPKTRQRIGSGVIHDGHIYVHNDPGIAECFELRTGKLIWEQRLEGNGKKNTNWSSIFLSEGKCYTQTQGGDCCVFRASPKFELLSVNSLGEPSNSSVIASQGRIYLRTHKHLWCIGSKD